MVKHVTDGSVPQDQISPASFLCWGVGRDEREGPLELVRDVDSEASYACACRCHQQQTLPGLTQEVFYCFALLDTSN